MVSHPHIFLSDLRDPGGRSNAERSNRNRSSLAASTIERRYFAGTPRTRHLRNASASTPKRFPTASINSH